MNILMLQSTFAFILSFFVEKLSWSLEVKQSTSLNRKLLNRFLIGIHTFYDNSSETSANTFFSWKPNTFVPNFLITLVNLHHYNPISLFSSAILMLRLFPITLLDFPGLWFVTQVLLHKILVLVCVFRFVDVLVVEVNEFLRERKLRENLRQESGILFNHYSNEKRLQIELI